MERAGADLSDTYNYFSVTQLGAEILEFKVDPVQKIFLIKEIENRSKLFLHMVYWVNFDLNYLGSQLNDKNVIICI